MITMLVLRVCKLGLVGLPVPRGVNKTMRPGGNEVVGRWLRTTPKGWGDEDKSVKKMVEEVVSEQERQ